MDRTYTEREIELIKEMGRLQQEFSLLDESEENRKRGERIREIRKELGLICKPRANRRAPIVRYR